MLEILSKNNCFRVNSRLAAIAVLGLLSLTLAACSATVANQSWPGLTLQGSMGYVAHNRFVSAVNLATGQKAWQYPEKADTKLLFYGDPLIDSKGDLVAATYNGSVFKLNAASGALEWKHDGDGEKILAPLVEAPGGDYYASSESGDLLIFDPAAGTLKSKIHLGKAVAWGAMALDAQRLYIATIEHKVYAVDFQSGKVVWSIDADGAIAGGVTLSGGKLYVGTFTGQVLALDAQTGKTLWQAKADGWVWQAPVAAGDTIFATDLKGTLRALSAADGSPAWNKSLGGPVQAAPAVDSGTVYIGTTGGVVRAYSAADGTQKWEQTITGGVFGTLRLFSGKLYITVSGTKYQLAELAPDSGAIVWTYLEPS